MENKQQKNFLPGTFKTIKGCASIPNSGDNRIILCFTDLNGELETDFAKILTKRWLKFKNSFRNWYRGQTNFKLGNILPIAVQTDTDIICLLVLNNGELDLTALNSALLASKQFAITDKKNFHINKVENSWSEIEKMLKENFINFGLNISVYEK